MAITNNLYEWSSQNLNENFDTDTQRLNGFQQDDYLKSITFNSALRTATLIPVGIVEALKQLYTGQTDYTIDQTSSKDTVATIFKETLNSVVLDNCNKLILGVLDEEL